MKLVDAELLGKLHAEGRITDDQRDRVRRYLEANGGSLEDALLYVPIIELEDLQALPGYEPRPVEDSEVGAAAAPAPAAAPPPAPTPTPAPAEPPPPSDLLQIITPELARKYQIYPLRREGMTVWVGMLKPFRMDVIEELRGITSFFVTPEEMSPEVLFRRLASIGKEGEEPPVSEPATAPAPARIEVDDRLGTVKDPVDQLLNVVLAGAWMKSADAVFFRYHAAQPELAIHYQIAGKRHESPRLPPTTVADVMGRLKEMTGLTDISEDFQEARCEVQYRDETRSARIRYTRDPSWEIVELWLAS